MIDDSPVRRRALDPEVSFIVQAPAGSGKTELLIQRYLRLLSRVTLPEAMVAITFTRKAAGEMRARVLAALRAAPAGAIAESPHQEITLDLARQALARDAAQNWQLLENPARLRVQTIDSLSASITRQMPWLARFGAFPEITEKASALYHQAARNTLRMVAEEERLGGQGSLSVLLLHLDNDFQQAERLIAQMLEKRDQWLRHTGIHPDSAQVRVELERSLERLVGRELAALRSAIPEDALRDILRLLELDELPSCDSEGVAGWLCLADLLLTKAGELRKKAPDVSRERWGRVADRVRGTGLLARLKELRRLPPTRFEEAQWEAMEALIDVLPKAVGHLQLVFRERGRVDFAELSIRATDALGRLEDPSDLALSLGHRIEHLLVDEFQDTSFTQFELLNKLTAGWETSDGRTLFLVGDPMQSIYRFREADVGLFLRARREGIGQIALEPLTLTANFRSDPTIVDWVNHNFAGILPQEEDIDRGAVPYSPSTAKRTVCSDATGPVVHAFLGEDQAGEAERILWLIESAHGTTAVLVRARSHLTAVVALLRQRGIPFQAIEIDQLGERAVIQDLMALTFALLHFADRIAWLAILRAPWCGLTLADLHAIAAFDQHGAIWDLVRKPDLRLTEDGRARVKRCLPVLEKAVAERGRVPLRMLVERTWLELGGPACVQNASDLADAGAYFDLLEGLEESGDLEDFATLREQVAELFAQPDSQAGDRLQIMTIHKAKGLEFDTVILPGLGQKGRSDEPDLLQFQEHQGELLLAPMAGAGPKEDKIYDYLKHLEKQKADRELARLLYVAVTRARTHLHLLGCARMHDKEGATADSSSFLKLLWPAVGHHFLEKAAQARTTEAAAVPSERVKPVRQIQRLTLDWRLPAAPPAVGWKRESLEPIGEAEVAYEWVGDTLRHVGTVMHRFLQRVAGEGVERWDAQRIAGYRASFRVMLANLGVPPVELAEAVSRVEKALRETLKDPQGRWILARHAEAQSEYQLTGLVDGKVCRAVIDRTFIDDTGVRWIVDYKTSLHEGGGIENFLENEKLRYQPQLERYARLIAQTDERPIRLALYFPLLNAWKEWGAPTIQRRQASLFD